MKTPRTDRNERIVLGGVGGDWKVVTSDFARQLETELQEMTALADKLAESLDTLTCALGLTPIKGNLEALQEAFNQARQSFADYEKHKKP